MEQQIRDYFEAMDRRDVDAMLEHWAEDGFEDMVPVGVIRGHDELRKSLTAQFAAMPDMRTTVTRLVAGEHNCAVEWRIEGTFDGAPYMDLEPTGSHIELRGIDLIELEDGQITSLHRLLRQLLIRSSDRAAARGRVRGGPRDEDSLQRGHEAPPRARRAPERRLMAVLVALLVGLVWWITAWAFGIKAFDAFLLTLALVVGAAAFQIVKPFLDQMLGREVAEPEEQGAGF